MSFSKSVGTITLIAGVIILLFIVNLLTLNKVGVLSNLSFKVGEVKKFLVSDKIEKKSLPDTIYFTGDIMLGRHVETLMNRHGQWYPYENLFINVEDSYLIGNFEGSVPIKHKQTQNNMLNFSIDEKYLLDLKTFGFTHVSLANNHSYDFGKIGFENTKIQLLNNQLKSFGHPLLISDSSIEYIYTDKHKVAVIGLNGTYAKPDSVKLKEILQKTDDTSDIQIIFIHWGNEYIREPSKEQRELAKKLIADGADLIVGHHPHVVQSIEEIDGKLVFYSLGNFIFDQYFSKNVQEGLILKLNFGSNQAFVDMVPITSYGYLSQPKLMLDVEKDRFLKDLSNLSSPELKNRIKRGTIFLNSNLATL